MITQSEICKFCLVVFAEDEGETKHLQALDGADTRLRLFQMDLVDPASVRPAIEGAPRPRCLPPGVSYDTAGRRSGGTSFSMIDHPIVA